jgi:hypothetical protein
VTDNGVGGFEVGARGGIGLAWDRAAFFDGVVGLHAATNGGGVGVGGGGFEVSLDRYNGEGARHAI